MKLYLLSCHQPRRGHRALLYLIQSVFLLLHFQNTLSRRLPTCSKRVSDSMASPQLSRPAVSPSYHHLKWNPFDLSIGACQSTVHFQRLPKRTVGQIITSALGGMSQCKVVLFSIILYSSPSHLALKAARERLSAI